MFERFTNEKRTAEKQEKTAEKQEKNKVIEWEDPNFGDIKGALQWS